MIGRTLAHLVDAALNRMAPMAKPRQVGADYLSTLEQDIDVWSPDELWAAEQRRTTQTPVGADVPAPSPQRPVAGADGPDSIELELKVTVQDVLRRCETPWPNTTAGIVAREILHHYTVTPR